MALKEINEQLSNDRGPQESERVTINVYEALTRFFKLHEEMQKTGLLTVQVICDIHRALMVEIPKDLKSAGEIRTGDAYVSWNDEQYWYPQALYAEQMFYACIDHHNKHMEQYKKLANEGPSAKLFSHLFRCAARLLFDFVDAHPFGNGNGRMCRLLANYVLTLITPFPVALYSNTGSGREDYLNAIVECREDRKKGPGTLAAMLIEGTWRGWKNLFSILEQNKLLTPVPKVIPPVVVERSDSIQQWYEKIAEVLKRFNVEFQSDIVDSITKAMDEVNVSTDDQDDVAHRIKVTLPGGVELHLHVYN